MPSSKDLKDLLQGIIGSGNVYFQPPINIQMTYPCIVYEWSNAVTKFADNAPYRFEKRYQIKVISKDPNSDIPEKIAKLPKCVFDRRFTAENLNHFVFVIFF